MFQAVGLNAMAAAEMRSDSFEKSTMVERSARLAIASSTVAGDVGEEGRGQGRDETHVDSGGVPGRFSIHVCRVLRAAILIGSRRARLVGSVIPRLISIPRGRNQSPDLDYSLMIQVPNLPSRHYAQHRGDVAGQLPFGTY